ncbi:mitochondrial protein [Ephemerocybe angulata]|uniref:Mitochondrial protein n=1 Tax=Ephemerocybe angulata TaxID=980116 RepID=A0A8H6I8M1_9AGAR|nr:mitochondrial protein [Tulosesus angulatus]
MWNRVPPHVRTLSRVAHGHESHSVPLASTLVGQGTDKPLVILHGLFGSKRNWKGLSKALHRALDRPIYALDLRNHGASPHVRPHTYQAMAEDVHGFIREKGLTNISLLGHSMGAKTAMTLALNLVEAGGGDNLSNLVVVDMPPAHVDIPAKMREYVIAMESLEAMPPGMIRSLIDADRFLAPFESVRDASVREFLLTNLQLPSHARTANPKRDRAKFILPLDILGPAIRNLEEFPYDYSAPERPIWSGPTLVIGGLQSEYHVYDYREAFERFFPKYQLEILDTGHWVQAERPTELLKLVADFLKRT